MATLYTFGVGITGALPMPIRNGLKSVRRALRSSVAWWRKWILRHGQVSAYWADVLNFGDMLTPALLESYGVSVCYSSDLESIQSRRTLVSCGSILGWVNANFQGYVLGSGLISPGEAKRMEGATFLSVRGALTRDAMKLPKELALGDPGLLAERLIGKVEKKYVLGIVPHQIEHTSPAVSAFVNKIRKSSPRSGILVISTRRPPKVVIEEIASCQYIVSSSLHGLIVADALSIPNMRMHFDRNIGDFKFSDYYSSLGEDLKTFEALQVETLDQALSFCKFTEVRAERVATIKRKVDALFRRYLREVVP